MCGIAGFVTDSFDKAGAGTDWLERLCGAAEQLGADIVGGPQVPVFENAADDSLRSFKPGKAWAIEPPAPLDMTPTPVAQDKPEALARAKLAAAPLPPVRPASFAKAAPEKTAPAPRFADRPADRRVASSGGLHLPGFVPTGADVMKRIGGLGASMRDSIGSVGSSLGKLMRISSR